MKKILLSAVMIAGFAGFSFAQTTKSTTSSAVKPAATKTPVKPAGTTRVSPATAVPKATASKPVAAGVVLKKDGTPDKRYKNAPASVPLKKDGTPDKRFKANKES